MHIFIYIIPTLATFLLGMFALSRWIKIANRIGLVALDMNKIDRPTVADMGGIPITFCLILGILLLSFINAFSLRIFDNETVLAIALSVVIAGLIGAVDDILGWKQGLKKWEKPLFTILSAIPIMTVVSDTYLDMYLIRIDFGMLYPLLIVPLGIVGASNGYNLIAGFNGLECGMGIIIVSSLTIAGYLTNSLFVVSLGLITLAVLLSFLYFNWYPARVFPGNSFTYSIGAMIGCLSIIGKMEMLGVVLFIPYFIDFILHLRKKLKLEAFGKPNTDGSLEKPYEKIYHLTHLFIVVIKRIKGKVYEVEVTLGIIILEIFIAISALCGLYLL